jgi:hypothetical protein
MNTNTTPTASREVPGRRNLAAAMIAAALFAVPALTAAPAMAQQQSSSSDRIERMSEQARSVNGAIYRAAGTAACRRNSQACGAAAERVGNRIFDSAREIARRESARIQEAAARRRANRQGN